MAQLIAVSKTGPWCDFSHMGFEEASGFPNTQSWSKQN